MKIIGTILLALLLLIVYMAIEARSLKVKKINLVKGGKGLRVLQLSDIHINMLKVSFIKIHTTIKESKPDIIFITGDYIYKSCHTDAFLKFLDYLELQVPVFACFGNHDHKAFKDDSEGFKKFKSEITSRGVVLLENSSVVYEKHGRTYNIIGLVDYSQNTDIQKAFKQSNITTGVNIAISHNPEIVLKLHEGQVDYLFCGHFHGGQIWAFGLEFKLLRNEKLCRMGIKRGLHKINGIFLYINSGIGNVFIPLRFLSPPEITVINLP